MPFCSLTQTWVVLVRLPADRLRPLAVVLAPRLTPAALLIVRLL